MHFSELTPVEQRVLGCLIEKRWTTPDQYPLSLNGLRLAANQLTNRDPVTDYDEAMVRDAAYRLSRYGLTRMASGHGSRAVKYRHLAEEALGLGREELAVLAVLLLRGAQTPGELKARSERMASFGSLDDLDRVLAVLCERGYARRIPRRPGQKEDRFEHLLGGDDSAEGEARGVSGPTTAAVTEPAAIAGPTSTPVTTPTATDAATAAPAANPTATDAPMTTPPPTDGAPTTPRVPSTTTPAAPSTTSSDDPTPAELAARVAALEDQVAELRFELSELSARLAPDQPPPSEL
jgi:uncharacterized protein YceH (UPF0502 family)